MLKEAGRRRTFPRIAVLQVMAALTSPVSHAEMLERLKDREFDEATIHRCLNILADAGVLRRLELGDRTFRFELAIPAEGSHRDVHHPHFLCATCGKIVCLQTREALSHQDLRRIRLSTGEVSEVMFKGTCHQCCS